MTIRTQQSISGFIASDPQLTQTDRGDARFYARFGASTDGVNVRRPAGTPNTSTGSREAVSMFDSGDLLDLHVALVPCIVGYAEIGATLAADPGTLRDGNPYESWIAMYAGDAFQAVARDTIAQLDRLMASRGCENRFEGLVRTFRQATQLEAAFWDMGLNPPA